MKKWMTGGEGDNREWDGWMVSLTQWTWVWASSKSWWWTGKPTCWGPWGCKESDTTEWLNWTEQKDAIFLWNSLYWNITRLWGFCWFQIWIACGYLGLQIFLCILGCLFHSWRIPFLDTCFEIEVRLHFPDFGLFPIAVGDGFQKTLQWSHPNPKRPRSLYPHVSCLCFPEDFHRSPPDL